MYPVIDPATGRPFAQAPAQSVADLEAAVGAAADALAGWAGRTATDRERVVREATRHVRAQADPIARAMAREQGKPLKQAASEVIGACDLIDYYAAEGPRIEGISSPTEAANLRSWVRFVPVGVCGLIVPWNYPIALLAWKLGPMLASGCTGVVKPAPETPLCTRAFCEALHEGGLPDGVVTVVTGPDAALGAALVAHPRVKKVAMTGSTATGKAILAACAPQLKKVSLELGGHCPAIVCADADIALAAKVIAYKGFRNMGQSCSSVNRVYAHASVHAELTERLVAEAQRLTLGDPVDDPGCDLGPFTTESTRAKAEAHVADALARGARLLCGGARPPESRFAEGFYYEPTVLDAVPDGALCLREETFGPVVPLAAPFTDLDDALARANDTAYGLCAYVFGRDFSTLTRLSEGLDAGTVCVNNGAVNTAYGPYEGWGDSGFGVELGRRAVSEYLKTQHIKVQL
jgi:acyl-CoA reductase-like NAD-dependent aldehyde dehydrogenase